MSFWGATVITNFFTAIPYVGESIAYWLWGGFSVNNATLTRFFSLHYLLPFLISGLVIVHLLFLHKDGSTNPVSLPIVDKISFYPYFYVKDLLSLLTFFVGFFIFVFIYPNSLGHSDNYIEANSMVTPAHIVPEWYFLPFYAILRSIPSKLGGVIFMGASILILYLVPLLNQSHRATIFG
jgi:ubiquinol-cytochrome c reductase cytochrome b subunit